MKIDRALRYGGYSTLVIAAVLAIVGGRQPPGRPPALARGHDPRAVLHALRPDREGARTPSASPIDVLALWEAGKEDAKVSELLRRYQTRSSHLRVRQVDPYRSPVELKRYEVDGSPPAVGSIVVDAAGRFKVLRIADLYETTQDESTGEQVPSNFIAESAITNAIASVTAGKDPVLYLLKGHGEKALVEDLATRLVRAFYDVRDLGLAAAAAVPDDATIVALVSPQRDILPGEAEALLRTCASVAARCSS